MSRSVLFLLVTLIGCSAPPVDSPSPSDASPGSAENLLLVTIDTLRADSLGFMGHPTVKTPLLDRLAAEGRFFTHAHAHNTLTLPSHSNILTGLYPYQHGVRENAGFSLPDDIPTLATVSRNAGLRTAAVVGAFPLDARFGLNRGFEVYDDRYPDSERNPFRVSHRRGDEVVEIATRWWNEHRGERRFLWVHLFDPHAPYEPPPGFGPPDDPYLGEVEATDNYLRPLIEPLLAGNDENTLIAVVADHGEGLGEHGEKTHGIFCYESTLRVPLILHGPGVTRGQDDRLARHVDLLPTLLEAAGITPPADLPGTSLLDPAPDSGSTTSYFEALSGNLNRGWAPLRGTIRDRAKFVDLPLPELYDLAEDPHELENVIDERRGVARDLIDRMPAESTWPPPRGEIPAELQRNLRSLGYLTESAPLKSEYGPGDDPKRLMELDQKLLAVSAAFDVRNWDEALRGARDLIEARPEMPQGHRFLAQTLLELDRTEDAIHVMREALALGHASDQLERQLGLALCRAGRPAEALEILGPLAEHSEDPASFSALGHALTLAGRSREGLDALERALELDVTSSETLERMSAAALRLERWEEARDRARQALDLHPGREWAWNNLGVALFNLGDVDGALSAWETAVEVEPRQFDTLFNLGLVAAQAGQTDRARRALEAFVAHAPPQRYAADIQRVRGLLAELPR